MIEITHGLAGWFAALLLVATPPDPTAQVEDEVHVVGALHGLHADEPAFDFDDLSRLIEAVQPQVLVLEVRPDELEGRLETPGRPEYPRVLWPWIATHDVEVIAMEPGGEDFTRISGAAGAAISELQATRPADAAYWGRLQDSFEIVLRDHWVGVADTQSRTTADLARAYAIAEVQLIGPEFETAQAEWDAYMLARAREAVLAHPGKRILVLGSYRNRAGLQEGLKAAVGARVVDTEAWLRSASVEAQGPADR